MIARLSLCEHRRRFVLIDLYQQYESVKAYTHGWGKEAIADWLQIYGGIFEIATVAGFGYQDRIKTLKFEPDDYYVFVPHATTHPLYRWGFRFDENGELEVNALSMWQRSQVWKPKISDEKPIESLVVIDLGSQIDAIRRYTRGWEPETVLKWLVHYGEIRLVESGSISGYSFRSNARPGHPYFIWFDDDNTIWIR